MALRDDKTEASLPLQGLNVINFPKNRNIFTSGRSHKAVTEADVGQTGSEGSN